MIKFIAYAFLALIALVLLTGLNSKPQNSEHDNPNDFDRRGATSSCMYFVKQLLHDPDSAVFAHSDEANVHIMGNRAVVVRAVRANNAFGAKRLDHFICFMEKNSGTIQPVLVTSRNDNTAETLTLLKSWQMPNDTETQGKP